MISRRLRVAFVVSHPIQYFVPLYQSLAQRNDVSIKVFFTWHAAKAAVQDSGFRIPVAWDIPVNEGYEYELVPNLAADPGTHHFLGLTNPTLVECVSAWGPDVVHVTGWAWLSHLQALRTFSRVRLPTLFRGDSHLLDESRTGPRWWLKREVLKRVYAWPNAFLAVGSANRAYYEALGVSAHRLVDCPHCIDVARFAQPAEELEAKAVAWRRGLGVADEDRVLLYAGKFEPKKQPLELMRAVLNLGDPTVVLIMVGSGELENEVRSLAALHPKRFLILPFQNQSRMPLVYRLGDLFVLPSAYGETWGLAVNEAMASGRAVLVSDHVGCARDLVDPCCGRIFSWDEPDALSRAIMKMLHDRAALRKMGRAATERSHAFDIPQTEETLLKAAWAWAV